MGISYLRLMRCNGNGDTIWDLWDTMEVEITTTVITWQNSYHYSWSSKTQWFGESMFVCDSLPLKCKPKVNIELIPKNESAHITTPTVQQYRSFCLFLDT